MLNIMPPPALQGDEQTQLTQVYRYLFRLSEQLNAVSAALDGQASQASEAIAKAAGVALPPASKEADSQFTALISLVVKTANIVQAQMDKVVTRLNSEYVAQSEWGTYQEEISREIEETARNTMESFVYDAKLEALTPDEVNAFDTQLKGFIVRGIIGFEEDGITPIIGIAIGRDLLKKTEVVNGQTYELIDTDQNMATYTADKLSFWINGVEVAYMSNAELVVTRIIVSDSIQLGNWDIAVNAKDGLTVQKRIGNELDLSDNDTITVTAEKINLVANDIDLSGNETIKITAEQVNAVAEDINLSANKQIQMIVGDQEELRKWFTFDNEKGLITRKPGSSWRTVTDELGFHIFCANLAEAVGSFYKDRLKTNGVQLGQLVTREIEPGLVACYADD